MNQQTHNSLDQEGAAAFGRLRAFLGGLGILLPLVLALTGYVADGHLQPTISDYFHTTQRDLLVGGLCAIGVFLAVHRGWETPRGRLLPPDRIARLAGIAAIGVAFFPNESATVDTFSQRMLGLSLAPVFHYGAALLLYLMMSMSCFLVFAPASRGWERRVHLWMGRVIFAAGCMVMVLSAIKNNAPAPWAPFVEAHNLIFWDESIGVWAFCLSWLLRAARERDPAPALPVRHLGAPAAKRYGSRQGTDPTTTAGLGSPARLASLVRRHTPRLRPLRLPQPGVLSARAPRRGTTVRKSRPRHTSPARRSGTAG
ncbi:hypothetical protein [uncultured Maritimibacter sp.]|jgi:hypothetical protein|uniref:hypothetical protein n=1 Tax=uncultured Maritimibacter sp. TaxID=991866 RepID=UPI0026296151|nr:hypothetical protein [uncultured Maritimibacter sp.]